MHMLADVCFIRFEQFISTRDKKNEARLWTELKIPITRRVQQCLWWPTTRGECTHGAYDKRDLRAVVLTMPHGEHTHTVTKHRIHLCTNSADNIVSGTKLKEAPVMNSWCHTRQLVCSNLGYSLSIYWSLVASHVGISKISYVLSATY